MKILKISLLLIFVHQHLTTTTCNQNLLEYYGLEGIKHPTDYQDILEDIEFDFCPGIQSSCCTSEDYLLSRDMWNVKNKNIKGYLLKWIQIVQKTIGLQSFLPRIAERAFNKNSQYCEHVNTVFFTEKINFQKFFFYMQSALQSFAEMQKGFYCSLCDFEHNKFMATTKDDRLVSIMSANFCSNIINHFAEFIFYKVNYVDPLIINTNFLMNCYYSTDENQFEFEYQITLEEINNCLSSGGTTNDCIKLCEEFKLGGVSDMFIGDLEKYEKFIMKLEKMVQQFDSNFSDSENLQIDYEEKFESNFFSTLSSLGPEIEQYNLRQIPVEVSGIGFDLSYKSIDSKYGYNGELEKIFTKNKDDVVDDGTHTNFNANIGQDVLNDPEERQKFEMAHKAQKYNEIEDKPDQATVETSELIIEQKEKELLQSIERDGDIGGDLFATGSLGQGSKMADQSQKSSYIWSTISFIFVLLINQF